MGNHKEQTKELRKLIINAEGAVMTPEEREAQRRSFAYGNAAIDNPNVTREMVDKVADQMARCPRKGSREGCECTGDTCAEGHW